MSVILVVAEDEGDRCSVFADQTPGFPLGKANQKRNSFLNDLTAVSFPWIQRAECTVKWSARQPLHRRFRKFCGEPGQELHFAMQEVRKEVERHR